MVNDLLWLQLLIFDFHSLLISLINLYSTYIAMYDYWANCEYMYGIHMAL